MTDSIKRARYLLTSIKDLTKNILTSSDEESWESVDSDVHSREKALSELSMIDMDQLDTDTINALKVELSNIKAQDNTLKDALSSRSKSLETEILKTRKMGKAAKNYQA